MPNSGAGGNNTINVEQLSWNDLLKLAESLPDFCEARTLLKLLAKEISDACLRKCKFLKLSYAYGDRVVSNGMFYLPNVLSAHTDKSAILEGFSSRKIPLAFIVDHHVEIFTYDVSPLARCHVDSQNKPSKESLEAAGHTRPARMLQQGQLFGLFQLVDAWRGRNPEIEEYSLAAGEVSIYIGVPMKSTELRRALRSLKPDLRWQSYQAHSLLIQELLRSDPWRCTIVLIPDYLCEKARQSPILKNLIYEAHISQMTQDKDDMNERPYLREINQTAALAYHEQIAYLLGIARGQIPAMVPWQRAETGLPLQPIIDQLTHHFSKRPTKKRVEATYCPYIVVPKLLAPGERGYFSCRWNMGPLAPRVTAFKQVDDMFYLLKEAEHKLFPSSMGDMFVPYVNSERLKDEVKVQVPCSPVDEADFVCGVGRAKENSKASGTNSKERPLSLWPGGFLNAGFVIKRPK